MFQAKRQIGSYTLIERIGRGGFGEVWLAERRSKFITKRVAIKLPHHGLLDFEEIRKEATLWEQASGHPNVLPLIDADVYDGQVAIVSEYAEGGSLSDRLKKQGKFPIREAVEMTIGILDGLEYLHSKQIIHRDIKPANILLRNNIPLLADFGISRALETSTTTSVVVGTEHYMAPEAFEGARSIQTDIWSVGVVLYELLKGSLPFPQKRASETMYAILLKEPEPLPDDVPPQLRAIVFKALEKDKNLEGLPPRRYQTAAEMRDDLKNFLETFSQPVSAAENLAPVLQNPQTEESTRVKLRIPIRGENGLLNKKIILPLALGLGALFFAVTAWFAVFLFSQSFRTNSNLSDVAANAANSARANQNLGSTGTTALNSNAAESSVTASEYADQGYRFFRQKKYDRAIEAYSRAIELSPRDASLYSDRGTVFNLQRKFDEALADFNKALELNPADSMIYNNRGVMFEDKGDEQQAIADYRKALELDPGNKRAASNLKRLLK